jgi:hypothetical protein
MECTCTWWNGHETIEDSPPPSGHTRDCKLAPRKPAKTRRRYSVEIYTPAGDAIPVGSFRSEVSARRALDRALAKHPSYETRSFHSRFTWSGSVYDAKARVRGKFIVTSESAPVILRPSVGEVGYW